MSKGLRKRINTKSLFLFDIIIIALSLFVSWMIRAQFDFFLYDIRKFSVLFPWVMISRMFFNYFFEVYTLSYTVFNYKDITRLLKYNLIATAILLLLRLFAKPEVLRMPISMIFLEYIFSSFGFLLVRLIFHNYVNRKGNNFVGYLPRVVLWGEVREIENAIPNREYFEKHSRLIVKGILNGNSFHWNAEYQSIRVFGDERQLPAILSADNTVSTVCFINPSSITKKRIYEIKKHADSLNVQPSILKDGSLEYISFKKLLELSENL